MIKTLGIVLVSTLGAALVLYLLWKLAENIHYARLRREAARREQAGNRSVCRWGIDSEGNITRVRVRFEPKD